MLFPNFGLGLGFNYGIAPGVVPAASGFSGDGGNYFTYVATLGVDIPEADYGRLTSLDEIVAYL